MDEVEAPFREILANGKITNFGKYNTLFEEEVGRYLRCHVATTSSGTMGMVLVMKALGVEPGKKVIIPSFTFMATAQAVLYAGAVPLFAEVRDDLTLCPDDLDRLLAAHGPDVTAVVPVHMYGLPAQVDAIQAVIARHAAKRGNPIRLVYDAAHAFGSATADGRPCGTFGDAEVFSLSVTKLLVSVEGGLVTSNDAELIQRVKKYRNYGIKDNYDAHWQGMNGKMSEFHAIIGLHNLRRIDWLLETRAEKAAYYTARIEAACRSKVLVPPAGVQHTFKDFSVVIPREWSGAGRDAMMAALKQRGVETRAYFYPPVHEQTFFRQYADRSLPRTEEMARRVLTLPFYTDITSEEMDYAAAMLAETESVLA
jgi:dTDP-4-amino-4,6-dideoxygalactose transaminase